MDSDKASSIAKEARSSISDYCINVCRAKCCKRGKLILFNKEEIKAVVGNKEKEYLKEKILEKNNATGNFLYDLEKQKCKNLKSNNLCSIHKDKNKPRICDDYPLFLTKHYIITAKDCEAVKNKLLDEYVEKIEKIGFRQL